MTEISIIVPVYNVEKFLPRCIDSILEQTYTNFELILVDDGSPDNCGRICDEYVEKDSRVAVIHQKNGGLSAARNAGLDWAFENSDSEWITFIDSDDWVHPLYLECLYNACIMNNLEIAVCNYLRTDKEELFHSDVPVFETIMPGYLWQNRYGVAVIACCKLYYKLL